MPYRLEPGEAVEVAVRRCAREQIDNAIEELTEGVKVDSVKAVHEARKSLKKQRSLLRLVRGSFDRQQRRRENATFREAGRSLGAARDADVMIRALDDLAERFAGQVTHATFAAIREQLESRREAARGQVMQSDAISEVSEELSSALLRIDDWHLRRDGWSAIRNGLLRGYQRGRKAFKRARVKPTVENLHDWRKRSKDLWYHLRLLRPISVHTMQGHAEDAHHLSDLLGDDHDLAVLRETVIETASEIPTDLAPVVGLIDHHRAQLQTEAIFLGGRLYAESPKRFLRRIHRYWKACRKESKAAASHQPAELAEATRQSAPV
jgi:CHAD domain-containing protein